MKLYLLISSDADGNINTATDSIARFQINTNIIYHLITRLKIDRVVLTYLGDCGSRVVCVHESLDWMVGQLAI